MKRRYKIVKYVMARSVQEAMKLYPKATVDECYLHNIADLDEEKDIASKKKLGFQSEEEDERG